MKMNSNFTLPLVPSDANQLLGSDSDDSERMPIGVRASIASTTGGMSLTGVDLLYHCNQTGDSGAKISMLIPESISLRLPASWSEISFGSEVEIVDFLKERLVSVSDDALGFQMLGFLRMQASASNSP